MKNGNSEASGGRMGLQQTLTAFKEEFARTAPEGRVALYESKIAELRASSLFDGAVRAGERVPDFHLPGAKGTSVSLHDEIASGPVVVTFYRGGWCPYCNIQLKAYQDVLPQIQSYGAKLIAVSPELPDQSLTTAEKNGLGFDVLSDLGNKVARSFGIVFTLPEELRAAMTANGKALPGINGDDSWELPVPATFVIDRDATAALAHIDVDYRNRLEPDQIIAALKSLSLR
jgi:peroxiredoxin